MKKYVKIFQGVRLPWLLILFLFAVTVVDSQVSVKTVNLTADIIDSTRQTIDLPQLLRYLSYMGVFILTQFALVWVGEITYGKIRMGVRSRMFGHILRLPSRFYDEEDGSELVSRITVDCDTSSYYFEVLLHIFGTVYQVVLVFINLLKYNRQIGLYSLLILPLTGIIAGIYGYISFQIARMGVNSNAVTTGYLFERTQAFRMIKAYGTTHREELEGNKMFKKLFHAELLNESTIAFIQLGMQLINVVTIVITFIFGGKMVNAGLLSIGELIAVYSLTGMAGVQLINLFLSFGTFTSVNGSMQRVAEILEMEEESTEGKELETEDQDICFENVSFSYQDASLSGREVLHDVSFVIPKNKVTAIIGNNGAGKSTVFKLLQKMYVPSSGQILFGDTDIQDYALSSWRDAFSVVSQKAPLISGTIRDNLCYGTDRPVSDEELMAAATACGIDDYIIKEDKGLDSEISVGSTNLSGGQRQALAIARAMVKDSRYLLLDEATRSLDAVNEQVVETAVARLGNGKTTVMIAHSPSATVYADYIIVMKDGRVDACGSPEVLLKTNDYYKIFAGEVL